jgi:hypothetical protein
MVARNDLELHAPLLFAARVGLARLGDIPQTQVVDRGTAPPIRTKENKV